MGAIYVTFGIIVLAALIIAGICGIGLGIAAMLERDGE